MKFIRNLMSRKTAEEMPSPIEPLADVVSARAAMLSDLDVADTDPDDQEYTINTSDLMAKVASAARDEQAQDDVTDTAEADDDDGEHADVGAPVAVNIWDLEDEDCVVTQVPVPPRRNQNGPQNGPTQDRFEPEQDDVIRRMGSTPNSAPTQPVRFPVGWILVAEGQGRGTCFALEEGMSQIGRGDDQAIRLDFGDTAIARVNHAAIVYDSESHVFMLGHGGKKNIVRLNGTPVISNETLESGDEIRIGKTVLRFVALCGADFNWGDARPEDDADFAGAAPKPWSDPDEEYDNIVKRGVGGQR